MPLLFLFAARPPSYSLGGLLATALLLALIFTGTGRKILFFLIVVKVVAITIIALHLIAEGPPGGKPTSAPSVRPAPPPAR